MRKTRAPWLWGLIPLASLIFVLVYGNAPSPQVTPDDGGASMAPVRGPVAPLTTFGDGVYSVPTPLQPGLYATAVPATSLLCFWEIYDDSKNEDIDHVIANGTPDRATEERITIPVNAKKFRTKGCGKWTLLTLLPQP